MKTIQTALTGRDNNFDFIRFAAALFVILNHSYFLLPNEIDFVSAYTDNRYDIGKFCVATFFIISGLLITRSFHRANNIGEYVAARVLRIYPGLIFVVFFTVFVLGPLLTTHSLSDYFTDPATYDYLFTNTFIGRVEFLLPGVFENNYREGLVNGSLWTLPNELACYIVVAIIGLAHSRMFKASLFFLALFLAVYYYKFFSPEDRFNFFLHGLYFASGAAAYLLRDKIVLNKWAFLIAAVVLVGNVLFNTAHYPSVLITVITLAYVVLYCSFIKTTRVKNFAKKGDYSYGIYIWAWPVQQMVVQFVPNLSVLSLFLISSSITMVFAYCSWHLIEKRAMQLKKQLFNEAGAVPALVAARSKSMVLLTKVRQALIRPFY